MDLAFAESIFLPLYEVSRVFLRKELNEYAIC